jgi:2'-deoxynucleoside 5'-phosphate N-hydrolase
MLRPMVYISGALSDVPEGEREGLRQFYEWIGGVCKKLGFEPYIPHQHSDPVHAAHLTPAEVDRIDRTAVTSSWLVVACAGFPSIGVGIELEMAYHANKPVILLYEAAKFEKGRISRLARGNPAVRFTISFTDEADLTQMLTRCIMRIVDEDHSSPLPEPLSLYAQLDSVSQEVVAERCAADTAPRIGR